MRRLNDGQFGRDAEDRFDFAIIPCSLEKAWDRPGVQGPLPARLAYRSPLFVAAQRLAAARAAQTLILSALHGLMDDEQSVPGPYDVTFTRPTDPVVQAATLRRQAEALGLLRPGATALHILPDDYAARLVEAIGPAALASPNLLRGVALADLETMHQRCLAALSTAAKVARRAVSPRPAASGQAE